MIDNRDNTLIEWLSFSSLGHGADPCGLSTLHGGNLLYGPYFNIATRDGMYMESNYIYLMAWLSYGLLWAGVGRCGLSSLHGHGGLGSLDWYIATTYTRDGIYMVANVVVNRRIYYIYGNIISSITRNGINSSNTDLNIANHGNIIATWLPILEMVFI